MTNDSNINEEKLLLANDIIDAVEHALAERYPSETKEQEELSPKEIMLFFILKKRGFVRYLNTYQSLALCKNDVEFPEALEDELNDALHEHHMKMDEIYKKHLGDDYMSLETANELLGEALNAVDSVIKI